MSDASFLLACKRPQMADLDYEVTYSTGLKHHAADALSRIMTDGTDQATLTDEIPTICKGTQDVNNVPEKLDQVGEVTLGEDKDKNPKFMM